MINVGENLDRNFLLKEGTIKLKTSGESYLDCILATNEQSIPAVLWTFQEKMPDNFIGSFVHVVGQSSMYRDKLQIKIASISVTAVTDDEAAELIPACPIDVLKEYSDVSQAVANIEDNDYRKVCLAILAEYSEVFKNIPAAKSIHQSGLHGLLMHTSYMIKCALALADIHSDLIDKSLLVTGVLCHDIGKVREFTLLPCGLVCDYSAEGNLLGHPYLGMEIVYEICKSCGTPYEKVLYLKHLIAAHSGKGEWGAIKEPQLPEAELLHLVDLTDAHMEVYRETYATMNSGESKRVFALDHMIYKR